MRRQRWFAPAGIGLLGVVFSCLAFWFALQADERRIHGLLEFRSEWRARDIEAKIRLSGNAVENIAVAMAVSASPDADQFNRIATRARFDLEHVNALQWAPRVPRERIADFERSARLSGLHDYRVFDVGPDLQRTELAERDEYFPVLYDVRFHGERRAQGLALGRYDERRLPMTMARDEGRAIATSPVRPIGPPIPELVYLLFWPVYDGIEVPATLADRRAKFRGYAVGNYNVGALLSATIHDTPEIIATIRFSIVAPNERDQVAEKVAATYSPEARTIQVGAGAISDATPPAVRFERSFTVFDQLWTMTFDYSPLVISDMRSIGAWGWMLAGLFLTASLVFYLVRERGRTEAIEALVAERSAELRRTSAQLHHAQKMEAIGNLTGGMAHDFNNLLAVIIGNLDLLKEQIANDHDAVALADAALQAGIRGADLTRQLLTFARRQPLAPKVTDVNELVVGMTRLLERTLGENIKIELITAPDVWPVMIDPAQLNSAIANLATNARDAMPNGGLLAIETRNTHLDADYAALNPEVVPGDFVLLEVSDTGGGMPPEILAQVFEPFFTTKEAGRGTGLGLSMVFGFVKQSQGHIKIYSEVGHGTTVRLYLPRAEAAKAVEERTISAPAQPQRGVETILVVEDNVQVRSAVARQLADLGYTVIETETPKAAMELIQRRETKVDLLFTDIVMPGGMNGHELARAALIERPGLKVLFTSGYPGSALRNGDRLRDGEHFLSKPYRKQDLARKLREVFGH